MTPVHGLPIKAGQNFAVIDLGQWSTLYQFRFEGPITIDGKVFLKQLLNLSGAEISLNTLPPSTSIPFYHKHHQNEEVYIFVSGQGEFQVDNYVFPVAEGTVVRVDPDGERCLRNVSQEEALCWVVIQARAGSQSNFTIEDGFAVQKRVSWVGKIQL